MDIDPYVAIVAAQRGITYEEALKVSDKAARNAAKVWFWRRALIGSLSLDTALKPTPVLYVDIDSTVRHGYAELKRLVTTAEDVVIYPTALAKLKEAKAKGWRIIGITNQGRIALGEMTLDQLYENMEETNHKCGYVFDKIMVCQHHPRASLPEMAECWCHKPRIGNVIQGALDLAEIYPEYYPPHMALFVGNQETDKQCAENAGIPFMWAYEWRGEAHAPTVEVPNPPPASP